MKYTGDIIKKIVLSYSAKHFNEFEAAFLLVVSRHDFLTKEQSDTFEALVDKYDLKLPEASQVMVELPVSLGNYQRMQEEELDLDTVLVSRKDLYNKNITLVETNADLRVRADQSVVLKDSEVILNLDEISEDARKQMEEHDVTPAQVINKYSKIFSDNLAINRQLDVALDSVETLTTKLVAAEKVEAKPLMTYYFIRNEAELIETHDLLEFCATTGWSATSLFNVWKGDAQTHKGWRKASEGQVLALKRKLQ